MDYQYTICKIISPFLNFFVVTPLVTPSSPRIISSLSSITATIPFSAANGYISFSSSSLYQTVSEPDSSFSELTLTLIRTGGFGTAIVSWTTEPVSDSTFSVDDIGINSGFATISNG